MRTLLAVLLLVASPALAQEGISKLSWMAGHWGVVRDGVETEEVWLAASGGMMLGMSRSVGPKSVEFEFIRIEQRKDGIFYVASPGGVGATPFRMIEHAGQRATFENRENDFPQRIHYRRVGDALCAKIEGSSGGTEKSREWCWQRR